MRCTSSRTEREVERLFRQQDASRQQIYGKRIFVATFAFRLLFPCTVLAVNAVALARNWNVALTAVGQFDPRDLFSKAVSVGIRIHSFRFAFASCTQTNDHISLLHFISSNFFIYY